jgi:hypothetical protein
MECSRRNGVEGVERGVRSVVDYDIDAGGGEGPLRFFYNRGGGGRVRGVSFDGKGLRSAGLNFADD